MRIENRIKTTQKSLYIKCCASVIAIIHIQIDITVCHRNPFIGDFHHLPNCRRHRRRRKQRKMGNMRYVVQRTTGYLITIIVMGYPVT